MNNQSYSYQYNYQYGGSNYYNIPPKDPFINREARHLAKLSFLAGAGVIGFIVFQFIAPYALVVFDLYDLYRTDFMFSSVVSVAITLCGVMLPFYIVSAFYSKKDKDNCIDFGKPVSARAFWLAVGGGFSVCLIGDLISGTFANFVTAFGISFQNLELSKPTNLSEFAVYILQIAVVPALAEEFAIRGIVMQPLRKYGDRFALIMSSFIFALMHGNMVQIPFAFIAGIALGYFAIATRSIWTSVAIHFANNFAAAVLAAVSSSSPVANFLSYYVMFILGAAGIACLYFFVKTDHYGFGFTFAPKNKIKTLITVFAVFFLLSYTLTISVFHTVIYILCFVLLVVIFSSYLKSNKKMLGDQFSSSLPLKLKTSLYCVTPSVLAGIFFLIYFTTELIDTTSPTGAAILKFVIAAILAAGAYMIYTVKHSPKLEKNKMYTASTVLMIIITVFFIFHFAF